MGNFHSLSSPALRPLWNAIHSRLSSGRPVSRVRVGPLDADQRNALADLLGLDRFPGEIMTISMAMLEEVLQSAVAAGVREVVAEIVGPIDDRAGRRAAAADERAALWEWLSRHEVVAAQPVLADWATAVRRAGLIGGSVERTREELGKALRVLDELPAQGIPLPVLADRVLNDSHDLDENTRCSGLVLRALATIYDVPAPKSARERRALWERAGVADDELSPVFSRPVCVLPATVSRVGSCACARTRARLPRSRSDSCG